MDYATSEASKVLAIPELKLRKRKNRDISEAFRRFDIYAPFITTLRIHGPKSLSFTVTGWGLLTLQATQGPLLPNLKELIFNKGVRLHRVEDEIQWIKAFSHEALRALHLSRHSELTSSDVSVILDMLVQKSPAIQELSLYPQDTSSYRYDSDNSNSNSSTSNDTAGLPDLDAESECLPWEHLSELTQLRSLSVTDEWLGCSFLKALSQLRNLHTFECHGQRLSQLFEPKKIDSYIGKGSFPALRRLSLSEINPSDVTRVLMSQKLLRNITSFRLNYTLEMEFEQREEWIVGEFLPMLANLPSLTELKIKETGHIYDLEMNEIYMIAEPGVLEAMAELPLKTIYLGHMHLGTGQLGLDLASTWPNVTELLMPSRRASPVELSYFAALPNLQRLVLRLDMSTLCNPVEILRSDPAPLRVLESGCDASLSGRYHVMYHNARILLQLWPDLESVTWSKMDESEVLRLAGPFDDMLKLCICHQCHEDYVRIDPNHPTLDEIYSWADYFDSRVWGALGVQVLGDSSEESGVSEDDE